MLTIKLFHIPVRATLADIEAELRELEDTDIGICLGISICPVGTGANEINVAVFDEIPVDHTKPLSLRKNADPAPPNHVHVSNGICKLAAGEENVSLYRKI
jgi:hypothetical protein